MTEVAEIEAELAIEEAITEVAEIETELAIEEAVAGVADGRAARPSPRRPIPSRNPARPPRGLEPTE